MIKADILSMLPEEYNITPTYRAIQIFEWLHRRGATSFDEMLNLPNDLRSKLSEQFHIDTCHAIETRVSDKDGTHKFLYQLSDEVLIESVRMEYNFGHSICISTQAGCRMACKFCASTTNGLIRNLTAGEMCAQVYASLQENKLAGIVLMGCGEPFDNYEQVIRFLKLIGHPKGANVGARHITISTCGLVPQMREFADLKLQVNLAVSLHATNDHARQELMPIAKRYPVNELMDACRYYIKQTNRRITFEYALVKGVNDSLADADALSKLLKGMLCHVNLIPINPTEAGAYSPTLRREAEAFATILNKNHIQATIRRTIGSDVDAACGQLIAKKRSD